jgi:hypothetical protein
VKRLCFIFKTEHTEAADDSGNSEVVVIESGVPILGMLIIIVSFADLLAISSNYRSQEVICLP